MADDDGFNWGNVLGPVSIGLGLLGMGQSHAANRQQARNEKAIGEANALLLERYADDLELVKADRRRIASGQAYDILTQGQMVRAQGRTVFAGRNVIIDHGTAYQWDRGLDAEIEGDLVRLRENLGREINEIHGQQGRMRDQAVMARYMGEMGAATAHMQATAGLISGAANITNTAFQMTR